MAATTKVTFISNKGRIKGTKNAVLDRLSGKPFEELEGAEYALLSWMVGDGCDKPELPIARQVKVARLFANAYEAIPDAARLPKGTLPGADIYIGILRQGARVNRNRQMASAQMAVMAGRLPVNA